MIDKKKIELLGLKSVSRGSRHKAMHFINCLFWYTVENTDVFWGFFCSRIVCGP